MSCYAVWTMCDVPLYVSRRYITGEIVSLCLLVFYVQYMPVIIANGLLIMLYLSYAKDKLYVFLIYFCRQ